MGGSTAQTKRTPRSSPDLLQPPSGFPAWLKIPAPIVRDLGNGRFRGDPNISAIKPVGASVRYVDRAGSGGNDGLTKATPWNIATAIAAVAAGVHGQYTISVLSNASEINTTTWATFTKSCRVVADSPGVRVTGFLSSGLTWTAISGSAGVAGTIYGTAKGSTDGVFDLVNLFSWSDRFGRNYKDFTTYVGKGTGANQAAALALITADGQWALDGTNVYVRPIGAMDLTNSVGRGGVRLRQTTTVGIVADGPGTVVYVRGIAFEGHTQFRAQNNGLLIAEDCTLKYKVGDGTNHDGGHSILIRTVCSSNGQDGLNYHDTPGNGTEFGEIDCVSMNNGLLRTDDINNATTSHEDCHGYRIGGSYGHTQGPTVADVNNARTWNVGCDARDALSVISTNRVNWVTDTTAEQWLHECSSDGLNLNGGTGPGYNFKPNGASAKIHLYGFRGQAWPIATEPTSAGGGLPDFYTP